jgi:1,4-dihydroxy-2-naphthoyl-CoA hydrolase
VAGDLPESVILDALALTSAGTLVERMGIAFISASADCVVGRMPVEGNTQPYGLLHGGASAVLAETLGSVAAGLHAAPDRYPVGIELSCTHHRSARSGSVTGTAVALTRGRTLATYGITITDDEGVLICTARLTCLLRDAAPQPPGA